MARTQLDSLDYKILQTLSVNGRKPYLEIARECGVSGAAIHQRIQKLMAMGVLKGSDSWLARHRWDMTLAHTSVSS